jgi:hypothetical protein
MMDQSILTLWKAFRQVFPEHAAMRQIAPSTVEICWWDTEQSTFSRGVVLHIGCDLMERAGSARWSARLAAQQAMSLQRALRELHLRQPEDLVLAVNL